MTDIPKTCFVLEAGEYSSYRVLAIATSLEEANRLFHELKKLGESDIHIDERPLDSLPRRSARPVWSASIDLVTGEVHYPQRMEHALATEDLAETTLFPKLQEIFARSAASHEHAAKLAIEARQEWLRTATDDERRSIEAAARQREQCCQRACAYVCTVELASGLLRESRADVFGVTEEGQVISMPGQVQSISIVSQQHANDLACEYRNKWLARQPASSTP